MTPLLTVENPAYFAQLAAIESRHWWSLAMWKVVSHWLDASLVGRSHLRALDIGCGAGQTIRRLGLRPEITSVVGLDPSPEALRHARRHGSALLLGSALELPFSDRLFDVVTCFDVLQHVSPGSDQHAASEIYRVLSPGGLAVVRSNAQGLSRNRAVYTLHALVDVLSGAGLHVENATYVNTLPALSQEIRGRLSRRRDGRSTSHPAGGGLTIRMPHPALNRLLGLVSSAEAWIAGRLRLPLPFGHSTLLLARRPSRD